MRFKLAISLGVIMIFGLTSLAGAAMVDFPPEFVAACQKEAPLNQKDIDAFAKMWPEMMSGGDLSEAEAEALYKKHGFTKVRGGFVTTKIINARTVLSVTAKSPQDKALALQVLTMTGQPKVLIPSDAEISLVEKNSAKLSGLKNMP